MRVLSLAAVTIAFAVVACSDATRPVATGPSGPSFEISDGAHDGNPYFNFLPPMMANPGHGRNVTGLAAVVDICAWDGIACTTSLAHFTTDRSTTTTTQPGNSETVRDGGDHYIVNWHTDAFNLEVGGTYRVCVSVGSQALGHADVEVVGSNKDLKKVDTREYVGLLDDRTLPIKFRIETGALEQEADAGCGGGAVPGTISGKVFGPTGAGAGGYPVYLFTVDGAGKPTALQAQTTTRDNGLYTFTSLDFVANVSYLVCEANPYPWPKFSGFFALEVTPESGGPCTAPYSFLTSLYAEWGYPVIAPAIDAPGVGGNDFKNIGST